MWWLPISLCVLIAITYLLIASGLNKEKRITASGLAVAGMFVCLIIGVIYGSCTKEESYRNALIKEVDAHYLNKKYASTYQALIQVEYEDGKFKSLELVPGTTRYIEPR